MAITVSSKQKAHLLVLSRHEDGQFYWIFTFLGIRAAKKKAPFALIVSINAKGDGKGGTYGYNLRWCPRGCNRTLDFVTEGLWL